MLFRSSDITFKRGISLFFHFTSHKKSTNSNFIRHKRNQSEIIKMRKFIKGCFVASVLLLTSCKAEKQLYVFSSFHEPATEGLRYLVSEDGVNWDSIPGVWLKPEIGTQKVMRDPSIVQTPDGTYHLVWTSSWRGDLGFGYANSKDLVNWSEQQLIPVMEYDSTTVNVWAPELFYDDVNDQLMVVWASCIPDKFEQIGRAHV